MRDSERTDERTSSETGLPLFAPGPSDPRWPAILRDYPHLAPAIESGFHQFFDGRAMVVDEARADQLRCCGNGVLALQGAVAFATLLRRFQWDVSE
jgi:hypothetical protein